MKNVLHLDVTMKTIKMSDESCFVEVSNCHEAMKN